MTTLPLQRTTIRKLNLRSMVPFLTGGLAFLVGGVILSAAGEDPIYAYQIMLKGAFGSVRALADTLVKTTSLLILGLAVAVAFKCKIWNIGAEGQLYFGALGGLLVGLSFIGTLPILAPIIVIITGFVFGALFSMIPAVLKVRLGVNEVIVTVLLNFVALLFISYLLHGPLKAPGFLSYSPNIHLESELPVLLPNTRLSVGILIAAASVIGVHILMSKTKIGFEIRSVGANIKAARYVGMNISKSIFVTMGISGGLAGIGGAILVAGVQHRLIEGISPGYGFIAVIVALLGKQNPIGVTIVAFFFSALLAGSEVMYRTLGVPVALAQTLQALVLVFVLIGELSLRWEPKKEKETKDN